MFAALANMAIRHPVRMALMALAMFIVAVVFGATAPGLLNAQNPFSDPSSASFRAEAQIQRATGKEVSPGVVALVPAPPGSAEVTAVAQAIRGVPGVVTVTAPVPGHDAGLVSADGQSSLVVVTLRGGIDPANTVSDIQSAVKD